MVMQAASGPEREACWLIGQGGLIEVYTVSSDPRALATMVLKDGRGVLLMNATIAATSREHAVMAWGLAIVADGSEGFYALFTD